MAAILAPAAAFGAVSLASAAGLPFVGPAITMPVGSHPCPGDAVVTNGTGPMYNTASVTVPAGCVGRTLQLTLRRSGSMVSGSAGIPAVGATVVPLNGTYDPTRTWTVFATVDGWDLPSTAWSYTPPPTPPHIWCTVITAGSTETCTATVTIFTGVKSGGSSSATYYDVVVTTTSTSYVQWEVGFNFEHDFYPYEPTRLGNSTLDGYNDGATAWTANNVDRESACSELPLLLVRGHDVGGANNFEDVQSDRLRQFSLVVNRTDYGYHDVIEPYCT